MIYTRSRSFNHPQPRKREGLSGMVEDLRWLLDYPEVDLQSSIQQVELTQEDMIDFITDLYQIAQDERAFVTDIIPVLETSQKNPIPGSTYGNEIEKFRKLINLHNYVSNRLSSSDLIGIEEYGTLLDKVKNLDSLLKRYYYDASQVSSPTASIYATYIKKSVNNFRNLVPKQDEFIASQDSVMQALILKIQGSPVSPEPVSPGTPPVSPEPVSPATPSRDIEVGWFPEYWGGPIPPQEAETTSPSPSQSTQQWQGIKNTSPVSPSPAIYTPESSVWSFLKKAAIPVGIGISIFLLARKRESHDLLESQ